MEEEGIRLPGRPLVAGEAQGELLVSTEPLSFWGGFDSGTGEIIDRRHPLSGKNAAGRVLAIPGTRGSSHDVTPCSAEYAPKRECGGTAATARPTFLVVFVS